MRAKGLKELRADAGLRQAELAAIASVSQPTYQRWEAGRSRIPASKVALLEEALGLPSGSLVAGRSSEVPDLGDRGSQHYGTVAFHFTGGGNPLRLAISESTFLRLHFDLQVETDFVVARSLANQLVAVRIAAIADVHFFSEADDLDGVEGVDYPAYPGVLSFDEKDWEVVAYLAEGHFDELEFPEADVFRVGAVMGLDERYLQLVVEDDEELDLGIEFSEWSRSVMALATEVAWQFSNGRTRTVRPDAATEIAGSFRSIMGKKDLAAYDMIALAIEGRERVAFLNTRIIDYVSLPAHAYDKGRKSVAARDAS